MFNTDVFSYKDYRDSASHKNEETEKIVLFVTFFAVLQFFSSVLLYSTQQDRIIFLRFGTFLMACQK